MKSSLSLFFLSFMQFALRENDYVLGAHKIGGNAQSISKNRWVHHTSFLWDFESTRMEYLQVGSFLRLIAILYVLMYEFYHWIKCRLFCLLQFSDSIEEDK
jgi:hypothetical protein